MLNAINDNGILVLAILAFLVTLGIFLWGARKVFAKADVDTPSTAPPDFGYGDVSETARRGRR